MSGTIELSLSPKYVSDWGLQEAVREILQNAVDGQADGAEVEVAYSSNKLSIVTYGTTLGKSTLLLGESGKGDGKYIGKYGEGYKLALLVLTRMGHRAAVYTNGEKWTPVFRESPTFGEQTLQLDVEPCGSYPDDCVAFEIESVSKADMLSFRSRFIALERFLGRDIGAYRESEYGTVLLESEFKGMFYVGGLYVQTDTEFSYGYDFKAEYVDLDRDRKAINYYHLKELTARALTGCGDTGIVLSGLKEGIADLSDDDTVLDEMTDEQSQNFKHHYFDKYGLEQDTFVGTKAMLDIVDAENVRQDNKIISRIIARASDREDELEELERDLREHESREAAITAFDRSDYKKLLVWLMRQKRVSKAARAEFMGLINGSNSLYFHNREMIINDIESLIGEES